MVATWNIAAARTYYTRGVHYYLEGETGAGLWFAPSGDFGLEDASPVTATAFENLYEAIGPDRKPLISNTGGRASQRVPAYDLTFSAPRSVSLAWAFATPDRRRAIEAAQQRAVRAALGMLEREATYARRGHGGSRVERVALTAALFQHTESRPAEHADGTIFSDPNLHTHGVVLNLATRVDGSVGALHSTVLRDWKMATGAAYHCALAAEMQVLGFALDRFGSNGTFELAGISDNAIGYFSARRREIEAELAAVGTTSAEAGGLAAAIAKSTRSGKVEQSPQEQEAIWRAAAGRFTETELSPRMLLPDCRLETEDPDTLVAARLGELPQLLTEHQSVLDRRDLVRAVYAALVGTGLPPSRAERDVDRLVEVGTFLAIGSDAIGVPKYSTPEMLVIEREIVAMAADLANRPWAGVNQAALRRDCRRQGLSPEQTDAALAAASPVAIAITEGAPGSGKTTTLRPLVAALQAAGLTVVGAATAWKTANTLRDDLGITSRATASWQAMLAQGEPVLDAQTVLVVDEAGLLDSRAMHALLGEVVRTGAKLILVGDRKQLQAIGAGPGLDLVARTVTASRIDTIVRQRDQWARDAVVDFGVGRSAKGLANYAEHGRLVEADGQQAALDTIVTLRRDALIASPGAEFAVIVRTNAQLAAVSRVIRADLQRQGQLGEDALSLVAVTPSGQSTTIDLAAGDRIRFLARHDGIRVFNGTVATITHIRRRAPSDEAARIEAEVDGRRIVFQPNDLADDKGRVKLGWAYASTVFSAQGMTVDQAVVLIDPLFDRYAIHVASSRARSATTLVVDRRAIDMQLAAERPINRQHDAVSSTETERRAFLAERLSRAHAKVSTLDVIDAHLVRDRSNRTLAPPTQRRLREPGREL